MGIFECVTLPRSYAFSLRSLILNIIFIYLGSYILNSYYTFSLFFISSHILGLPFARRVSFRISFNVALTAAEFNL